jgi:pimeloyl-ACP methyl ester carboxylesterase
MASYVCLSLICSICIDGVRAGNGSTPVGLLVLMAVAMAAAWFASVVRPPPPKTCGTPGGPPVTAPRVRTRDGRFLAYEESGVSRDAARFKVVYSHGFSGGRMDSPRASQALLEELGVYMVAFDRAGYGESDPDPRRSLRSAALDVEDLADALGLGDKFHLICSSLGCHAAWASFKYIPHR